MFARADKIDDAAGKLKIELATELERAEAAELDAVLADLE